MAENRLLYLSQADVVAAGLSMAEIIDALETAFRAKGEGRTEMPPKPGVHPGGGNNFIHAMPAYIQDLKSAGVKWVSGYPENHKRGLPYITGLLIYNDVEPRACRWPSWTACGSPPSAPGPPAPSPRAAWPGRSPR